MSGSIMKRVVDGHRQRRGPRVQIYVRLPPDLHGALDEIARMHSMSFNALVCGVLRAAVDEEKGTRR